MTRRSRSARCCAARCWPLGAGAQAVADAPLGEAVERHLPSDEPFTAVGRTTRQLLESEARRPARDARGRRRAARDRQAHRTSSRRSASSPAWRTFRRATSRRCANVLDGMRDRHNVRLHLVGHADYAAAVRRARPGLRRQRGPLARARRRGRRVLQDGARAAARGHLLRVGRRHAADRLERDRRGPRAEPPRRGRGLVRRGEGDASRSRRSLVTDDFKRVKVCRVETVCKLRYQEGQARRARVRNLVAPLHYEDETIARPRRVHQAGRAGARATCATSRT